MASSVPWGDLNGSQTDALPPHTEVAVVGGGLAGLTCALHLARGGVKVAVLESEKQLGSGAVGRGSGLAHLGLCEHPIQLAQAVGNSDAEDLIRLSLRSLELLGSVGLEGVKGGIWCASMDREAEGIERSTEWLQEHRIDCETVEPEEVQRVLGKPFGLGRFHAQELAINPLDLLAHLSGCLRETGGRVLLGHRVQGIHEENGSLAICGPSWRMETQLVVIAAGAWAVDVDPWFQQKVFPVRAQHRFEPESRSPETLGRSQHGYVTWGPVQGGRVVSGCRWASPHLEIGESTPTLNPKVSLKLREFSERLGGASEEGVVEWSSIMGFSCDGLPVLGPMPGQPRKVSCVGFNGQDLSLAMACAEQVARGILEGGTAGISSRLLSSRFVDS